MEIDIKALYLSALLSCTSSTIIWVTSDKSKSVVNLCNSTPTVQNVTLVLVDTHLSNRIWYPMISPISSSLSAATRVATPTALILRG